MDHVIRLRLEPVSIHLRMSCSCGSFEKRVDTAATLDTLNRLAHEHITGAESADRTT